MKRLKIEHDSDCCNPRTEYENAGQMFCWHNRYNLGDRHNHSDSESMWIELLESVQLTQLEVDRLFADIVANEDGQNDYDNYCADCVRRDDPIVRDDFVADYVRDYFNGCADTVVAIVTDHMIVKPIYLYDHSGITVSHGGFSCSWDSGQVGWHVMTTEAIASEFAGNRDRAEKCLESELSTYDDYLTGNVWGFILEEWDGDADDADIDDGAYWSECNSCWGFLGYQSDRELADAIVEHVGPELSRLAVAACRDRETWHFDNS